MTTKEFLRQLDPQIREAVRTEVLFREEKADKLLERMKRQVAHQEFTKKMIVGAKVDLS